MVIVGIVAAKTVFEMAQSASACAVDYPIQLPLGALKLYSLEIVKRIKIFDQLMIVFDGFFRLVLLTTGGLPFGERLEKVEGGGDLETLVYLSGFTELASVDSQKQSC